MSDFDPLKSTAEERQHALMVVGWTLTVIKNVSTDEKVQRAVDRAERALQVLGGRITSTTWPPEST
jgi:hypothetical protein